MKNTVYILNQFADTLGVSIEVVSQQFESMQKESVIDLIQIIIDFLIKLKGKCKNKLQNFKKDLEDD